jgi:hypothetical protein
MTKQL